MKTEEKNLDCVAFPREAALRIHAALEGKSDDERMIYWAERSKELRLRTEQARVASKAAGQPTPQAAP
jgi:hypothetical protein